MDIQELLKCAEAYEGILDRRQLVKEDEDDLLELTKARAGLTNMELRAFKRIMKAKHKDQLDKLDEQTEAQSYLRDVLTDKRVVDKKVVAIPHDPQTGEIIGINSADTAEVAPDCAQDKGVPHAPQETGQGRDSLSNDIIGDMPACLRRSAAE